MIRQIAPQFFTLDMATTLGWYQSQLGFRCLGTWLDPPVYAIVERDGQRLHFRLAETPGPQRDKYDDELLDAYFRVDEIERLYAEFVGRQIEVTRPLAETEWQAREFVIRDVDGRLLAFGAMGN